MSIGELASSAGVTPKTVRYYEQLGLLRPASRSRAGYRRYGPEDLSMLRFIGKAKRLGLSLQEIRSILTISARGSDPCPHVVGLLDEHLRQIDETLARLSDFRSQLGQLRGEAERATKGRVCGIIEHTSIRFDAEPIDRPLARRPSR